MSSMPFYQLGFGQQNLPNGKQIHDYVAAANNLKPKENANNSFFAAGRNPNQVTSFIGS